MGTASRFDLSIATPWRYDSLHLTGVRNGYSGYATRVNLPRAERAGAATTGGIAHNHTNFNK